MDKIKRLANGYMYIRIPKEEYFKKETEIQKHRNFSL